MTTWMTTYERNDHFFYLEFKDLENQSGKTLQTASKSLQSSLKYAINHYIVDDFWRKLRARQIFCYAREMNFRAY